jgi:hypothetical protein
VSPRRYSHHSRRDLIEQAIARGESLDWIVEHLGVDPHDLDTALRRMDAASAGQPVEEEPVDVKPLDEVLVQRLVRGDARVPRFARCPERIEAIRILAAQGLHDRDIAHRIGGTPNSVSVLRSRHSIPAGRPNRVDGMPWRDVVATANRYRDRREARAAG